MRNLSRKVVLVVATTALALLAAAQAPAQKPQFEVATIKPSDTSQRGATIQNLLGGRFVARGVPLRPLMTYAYHVQNFQISGGPGWMVTDRWDIEARAEEGSIPPTSLANPNAADPMAIRLQSLLEDRFQLKIHRETKEFPIYELTIAKSGLKMKLSDDQTPFKLPEQGAVPPPSPPQRAGGVPRYNMRIGRGNIQASAVEIPSLVQALSQQAGRTIIDKTGLKGLYDINLQWTPDTPPPDNPTGPTGAEAARSIDINGPSIFTALQEQLGLRLESAKGPVEVIVIDSVQKPSEN